MRKRSRRRIARRDLLELHEIGLAGRRIVVAALEMRLVPAPHRSISAGQAASRSERRRIDLGKGLPVGAARAGARSSASARVHRRPPPVEDVAGRGGPDPRQELQDAEAGDAVARVLGKAQAARARP